MTQSHIHNPRISDVSEKVIQAAKDTLGDKLDKVILYGSYARGDFDEESDIDFFILADVPQEEVSEWDSAIYKRLRDLNLEYDILVQVGVTGREVFYRFVDILPFYMNVTKEGVELYAS